MQFTRVLSTFYAYGVTPSFIHSVFTLRRNTKSRQHPYLALAAARIPKPTPSPGA
jgi:hypothetical protein